MRYIKEKRSTNLQDFKKKWKKKY